MGDLRDMLLKAGLVSAEQAKKAEEESRQDQQRKGGGSRQRGGGGPRQREGRGGGPAKKTPPPEVAGAVQVTSEALGELHAIAQSGKLEGRTRGQRRWYFVSRRGTVPYLEVSDEIMRELEQGAVAIAETDRGDTWLVTQDCARQLAAIDPRWVRSSG